MKNFSIDRYLDLCAVSAKSAFVGTFLVAYVQVGFTQQSTTCHTCSPNWVPGSIVGANMTLGQLSEITLLSMHDRYSDFMSILYAHCKDFPGDERGAKTLRKRMLLPMEKQAPNSRMESFFMEAGCNPENFSRYRVTISQIAAKYPLGRLDHLKVSKKYFQETNKPKVFAKILNAKNTRGYTTLDYMNYLIENRKISQTQIEASKEFTEFLCSNGACTLSTRTTHAARDELE